MDGKHIALFALGLRFFAAPLAAGQLVTLDTGFQIRAKSVEYMDLMARVTTDTGTLEFRRTRIAAVEPVDDPAPPAPVVAPVPAVANPAAQQAPLPVAAPPSTPKPKRTMEEIIQDAADRYGIPAALVRSVAKTESGMRQDAISPKGAIGVMQLMPKTAALLEADPTDLEQNIDAGARYLRDLLVRYDGSAYKALAAYNAGEKAVDRYNGIPPYEETQTYVRRVLWRYVQTDQR